ncbi:hypothetical protein B0H13DRAFT_1889525 [Mycena leptocephala]|nr:hypothetical protein B0H13DRAFT_1889525 [Mycena leptocephala]
MPQLPGERSFHRTPRQGKEAQKKKKEAKWAREVDRGGKGDERKFTEEEEEERTEMGGKRKEPEERNTPEDTHRAGSADRRVSTGCGGGSGGTYGPTAQSAPKIYDHKTSGSWEKEKKMRTVSRFVADSYGNRMCSAARAGRGRRGARRVARNRKVEEMKMCWERIRLSQLMRYQNEMLNEEDEPPSHGPKALRAPPEVLQPVCERHRRSVDLG